MGAADFEGESGGLVEDDAPDVAVAGEALGEGGG
jgi:hypothetical protein